MTDTGAIGPVGKRDVEWYRECPHCWDQLGGVGQIYKTLPAEQQPDCVGRRYYRCDCCGNGFVREFEVGIEVIEKRVVTIIRR